MLRRLSEKKRMIILFVFLGLLLNFFDAYLTDSFVGKEVNGYVFYERNFFAKPIVERGLFWMVFVGSLVFLITGIGIFYVKRDDVKKILVIELVLMVFVKVFIVVSNFWNVLQVLGYV